MTAAQLERLQELQRLRLFKSRDQLEALLHEAIGKKLTYADFLDQVLTVKTEEVTCKNAKHAAIAHVPFVKGLVDFSYQPRATRSNCRP